MNNNDEHTFCEWLRMAFEIFYSKIESLLPWQSHSFMPIDFRLICDLFSVFSSFFFRLCHFNLICFPFEMNLFNDAAFCRRFFFFLFVSSFYFFFCHFQIFRNDDNVISPFLSPRKSVVSWLMPVYLACRSLDRHLNIHIHFRMLDRCFFIHFEWYIWLDLF